MGLRFRVRLCGIDLPHHTIPFIHSLMLVLDLPCFVSLNLVCIIVGTFIMLFVPNLLSVHITKGNMTILLMKEKTIDQDGED